MRTLLSQSQVGTPSAVPPPQPSSKMPADEQLWLRQLVTPSPMATSSPTTKTHKPSSQPRQSTTQNIWSQASFPVENFQAYTSGFGWRSQEEEEFQFHSGLDIAAPVGSYVRNWWVGQVIVVAEDSFCGNYLVIKSEKWQAVYCHLEGQVSPSPQGNYLSSDGNIMIVQDQWVATGAPIGRVGMTGRTTGPHLHWGVKYAGQWVDPALVLRAMYAMKTQK